VPAELSFRFLIDGPVESQDFFDTTVGISCRGFAGATRFTIARRDLAAFAGEVAALRRGEGDVARLVGGWDAAQERLRLHVTRAGTTGLCAIRVRVANIVGGPKTDQWDRVETEFVCTAADATAFADALTAGNSAQLLGDERATT
jgi:hypothetical protein